jgi:hypothetical protein
MKVDHVYIFRLQLDIYCLRKRPAEPVAAEVPTPAAQSETRAARWRHLSGR